MSPLGPTSNNEARDSNRIRICSPTYQSDAPWVKQLTGQTRNLVMESAEPGEKASYLIKVSERKFTTASAERFVQSVKNECVDQFVVFGGHHLEYLIREYEDYYNPVRPHQGIENRTIGMTALAPPGSSPPEPSEVECDSRLGGLLRQYYRKAA